MYERSYGYRYDEIKGKPLKDIAAMMRRDIKQAITDGLLPGAPVKYSVTVRDGSAIEVRVKGWASAWQDCDGYIPDSRGPVAGRGRELCRNYFCQAMLELTGETRPGAETHLALTPDARAAEMTLERIHGAYNHNGSEVQVDYFDVNYYGGVKFETPSEAAFWAGEADKKAARRAAIDTAAAGGEKKRVVVYGAKGKRTVHDAVETDGRVRLVCGATLWRHSMTGDGSGCELTCSRCQKRAAAAALAEPVTPARVMRTYDVLQNNRVVRLDEPRAQRTRVTQYRTSADADGARVLIAALFPDAVSFRAPGELAWRSVRGD